MQPIIILADDLTGACDTALPFFQQWGTATVVATVDEPLFPEIPVVSINVACRHENDDVVARKLQAVWAKLPKQALIYLKMDSTLRGNWPAMVKTAVAISKKPVVVAPAYPAAGRTTVGGMHLLHGVPVHQTVAGNDPLSPVTTSHLPIGVSLTGLPQTHMETALLARGVEAADTALTWMTEHGATVLSADAQTEADMALLVDVITKNGWIPCGSAGLAKALALGKVCPKPQTFPKLKQAPLCSVSGSQTPLTQEQLEKVQAIYPESDKHRWIVSRGNHASNEDWAKWCRQQVDKAAKQMEKQHPESLWVLCGGETAAITLKTLGIHHASVAGEVAPNMALLQATSGVYAGHTFWFVLKSGNFGHPAVLVEVLAKLRTT